MITKKLFVIAALVAGIQPFAYSSEKKKGWVYKSMYEGVVLPQNYQSPQPQEMPFLRYPSDLPKLPSAKNLIVTARKSEWPKMDKMYQKKAQTFQEQLEARRLKHLRDQEYEDIAYWNAEMVEKEIYKKVYGTIEVRPKMLSGGIKKSQKGNSRNRHVGTQRPEYASRGTQTTNFGN